MIWFKKPLGTWTLPASLPSPSQILYSRLKTSGHCPDYALESWSRIHVAYLCVINEIQMSKISNQISYLVIITITRLSPMKTEEALSVFLVYSQNPIIKIR